MKSWKALTETTGCDASRDLTVVTRALPSGDGSPLGSATYALDPVTAPLIAGLIDRAVHAALPVQ